jgi:hypothetical protein
MSWGLFTGNSIFVSHHVIRKGPTHLGFILIWSDDVVQHGVTQKLYFM